MNQLIPSYLASLEELGGRRCIVSTSEGAMDAYRFVPTHNAGLPLIFYCDAGGVRPAMFEMARQLADCGHDVLMPNLYYRLGTYAPFDAKTVFENETERTRLMGMAASLDEPTVMRDTAALFDMLAGSVGVLGYCLGGGMALRAAAYFSDRIVAAASIHGGGLATDAADSPHRLISQINSRLYIGVAGIDPHFSRLQQERLEGALKAHHTQYQMDTFADIQHGFAVPDVPAYDPASANAVLAKLQRFFAH